MLNTAKDQRGEVREQIVLSGSCSITTADELGKAGLADKTRNLLTSQLLCSSVTS